MAIVLALCWRLVAPLRRSDLMVFLQAGSDVLHGVSPYTNLDDPFLYGGSAFVYPWWTAVVFAPLSVLPTQIADVLWTAASVGVVVLGARVAGVRTVLPVLVVLTTATTLRGFQVGSLNAFLLLGCVVAWRYRERAAVAGWALALVVGAKLFLVPLLCWLLLTRRLRALAHALLGLVALLGASFALGPLGAHDYASMLRLLGAQESAQGFSLHRLLATTTSPGAAGIGCLVAAAGIVLWGVRTQRAQGEQGDLMLFACCLVASLLLTPIVWSHYLVLLFAPLLLHRARLWWFVAASATSWIVAAPVLTHPVLSASVSWHISLLFVGVFALLASLAKASTAPKTSSRTAA
ncbi:MAG: glycosyltransferase 87 family protein [Actinomycetota bacterium]|nr:glycosyltransferase 87 family protein [Actinomycetota bacterium]